MKKQIITLIIFALLPLVANAETVEIDGIYYNLIPKAKVAEVTSNPNKYTGTVVIPETVEYNGVQYSVTSIGDQAFNRCSGLTSVTIPNSVTSIEGNTFYGCSGLTSITIPNSVTNIGGGAFYNCSGLKSVTVPNSVTSIKSNAFFGCSGLTSVTIPNSVTSIGRSAFSGCSGLTSITISNSVTIIESSAFANCSGLTDVTIPNSVTSIGSSAFKGCNGLQTITIGNFVNSIESSAFSGCSGLTNVTIPNSVVNLWGGAFYECTGLKSINIPNSVTIIRESTFSGCSSLTSIIIPNSVTSIGDHAFYGCSGLTNIAIPNSVTAISNSAFNGCTNLTTLYIGSGVSSIGLAFKNCTEITDVYCYPESVPNTNPNAFSGSYIEYATLHVPVSSLDDYNITEPWKSFNSIVAIDHIKGDANRDNNVDSDDISEIANAIVGKPSNRYKKEAADINNDRNVDAIDITELIDLLLEPYKPHDLIPPEYFANTEAGDIPEGFYVMFYNTYDNYVQERFAGAGGFGSGPRMFDFAAGGDFTKGFFLCECYLQFGSMKDYPLTLEAGKKYLIHFNTAMWKDTGTRCRFEILTDSEESVLTKMVDNAPNMNGNTSVPVTGSTSTDLYFIPETSGNYILRWTAANSEEGSPGFYEVLLGNVSIKHIPNAGKGQVSE